MNPQEKLEAMFCPRLDSALVASIYNDMGDFAACIPILSALAKAAISDDEDEEYGDPVKDETPLSQSNNISPSANNNNKKKLPAKKKGTNNNSHASTTNTTTTTTTTRGKNRNPKTGTVEPEAPTTPYEQVAHHPLKEKILLWTENVAASQSTHATSAHPTPASSSSSSADVQYLPSPASVQPLTAPAGFKGFKPSNSKVQVVARSTLGSTLPSTAASATDAAATSNNTPAARLKAVRNPNFQRDVASVDTVESLSSSSDEQEEEDEETRLDDTYSISNSDVASTSTTSASATATASKKKNRRSGRGKKDKKKREALRAQAAANSANSVAESLGLFPSWAPLPPAPPPPPLMSWKKDRGGDSGGGGGGGWGGWQQQQQQKQQQQQHQKQREMDEMASLLDTATRLSSVQLHHEPQQLNGSHGGVDEDDDDDDDTDDDDDDDGGEEDEGDNNDQAGSPTTAGTTLDTKRREQVSFLRSCFPDKDHSSAYLTQCLQESRWDIEAAVELILSRMFLENEQVETSSSGSNLSAQSRATTDSSWTTVSSNSNNSNGSNAATAGSGSNDDRWMYGTSKKGGKNRAQYRRILLESTNANTTATATTATAGFDTLSNTLTGQDAIWLLQQQQQHAATGSGSGSGNDWTVFEHQIQNLMTTFYLLPRKTIVATFHAQGANLIRTIEALEARQREQALTQQARGGGGGRKSNNNINHQHRQEALIEASEQFDTKLAQLVEMFPGHAVGGLKKFLVYSQGNVQEAMNAVLAAGFADEDLRPSALAAAAAANGGGATTTTTSVATEYVPLPVEIRYKNDRNGAPIKASLLTEATGSQSSGGWSRSSLAQLPSTTNPFPQGVRSSLNNTLLEKSNAELYNDEDDPVWCRHQAHEVLQQRNELFRKAAKAYQHSKGKGAGMGGIAAYYADEGKKLDVMGKKLHMRAARAVVQQHRLENNDVNLVDLHGLTISEAQTVVREAVTEWFARSTMQANRIAARPLRIVTGVGSHSKDRIARLYPSILSMLQKDGWRIETESGVILVKGVARLVTTSRK
ncbi:hypothetical protein DFQ26_008699 [Actinomortierella ambigua]|nr:hypothetical protein DFQ26_008699 [Actinomortierella ambigua]